MATVITPRDGEKVLFNIRKNFFVLLKPILKFVSLFVISVIGFFLSRNEILTLGIAVVFLFDLSYGLYHFLLWFYDVYIITNQRVIRVEQKSIFSKEYSELDYSGVKDVTYAIKGVMATLFRFGSVFIKGVDTNIELNNLSYPDEIQEIIKKLSSGSKGKTDKEMSAKELIEIIAKTHK